MDVAAVVFLNPGLHLPCCAHFSLFSATRRGHAGADEDPSLLPARPGWPGGQEEAAHAGCDQVEQEELVLEVGAHPPRVPHSKKGTNTLS